jgi:hypothetical protein
MLSHFGTNRKPLSRQARLTDSVDKNRIEEYRKGYKPEINAER